MPDIKDLWPDDIGETDLVPPVAILREQASLLGRKTNQLVRARVESTANGDTLSHEFIVRAPALDYQISLFTVNHDINLYPVDFYWHYQWEKLSDSDTFVGHLGKVLQSYDTKKVIHSLLAQVKSEPAVQQAEITDEDIPF